MSAQFTARYPTGQVRNPRIVALGDSTTAGTPGWESPLEAPPHGRGDEESQFPFWLMQMHPTWTVLNRGINGERTDQICSRFGRDVLGERADIVIVIAGVNDIYQGRSRDQVQRGLAAIYREAAEAAIPVVAGSILPYNTATPAQIAAMQAVNAWIRQYAEGHPHILFCDTRAAVARPDQPDLLAASPDGLHPTADGYRLMALALAPVLSRLVENLGRGGVDPT